MLNKKIANIVFYKVPQGGNMVKQATIFYQDGTVKNVSFEDGIDACEAICRERHIQTKDAFKEMINRDVVHVMTAKQLSENYSRFIPAALENAEVSTKVEEAAQETEEVEEEEVKAKDAAEEEKKDSKVAAAAVAGAALAGEAAATPKPDKKDDGLYHFDDEEEVHETGKENQPATTGTTTTTEESKEEKDQFSGKEDFDSEVAKDAQIEDPEYTEEPKEEKKGFFGRLWAKIKANKLVRRVILGVTALAVACGIYSAVNNRKSLEGEMYRSNLTTASTTVDNTNEDDHMYHFTPLSTNSAVAADAPTVTLQEANAQIVNTHYYDNAAISGLLARTQNQTQKNAMSNLGAAMDGFNNVFASYYLEEGVDVRPALKFEEVVAMQVAYNDYSKDQLKAYFNGADIKAEDLSRAYKDGNLQLMGAYAIENPEHPIDMSMLIDSEEGKAFYQRYHEAFLAAKMATGDEKIRLVSEFYQMVHNDFPVSEKERTEGISHSENYENLPAYKLSVTPMIAAAEMMWQNLETDVTLNDSEIDFINDLGLCNRADKSFERAELVALTSDRDNNNPTYEEYRTAFINYYVTTGTYYVDDEHRELTYLQSFQDAVNWHFDPEGEWTYQGHTWTETETHTETHHWTETETTYHEETESHPVDESQVPEEIRDDLQDQVDAEIEAENERRRREAEAAAEAERLRLQAEADAQAAQIEQEVQQDNQDLQDNIDHANETINHNHEDTNPANDTPVNEADLGHGVDFDDDHSDSQGNLDSSVENITTDSTGDQTGEPLPDPNETGREFDAQANNASAPSAGGNNNGTVESVPVADDYYYEDSWIEYDEPVQEEGYQYHK